jgi:acetate kinase
MEAPISSPDCIAVINAGSSSVKFALYAGADDAELMYRGQVEGLGIAPHLRIRSAQEEIVADQTWPAEGFSHEAATREILAQGRRLIGDARVIGIGHRVVHGGPDYSAPVRLNHDVLSALSQFIPLAPLHQPHNLAPIRAIMEVRLRYRRSPASTQPSIAPRINWRSRLHCRAISMKRACVATGSTGCPISISCRG